MKHEILTYLRNNKPYAGSTLAQFLIRTKGYKSQREVKDALQSLIDEQSIEAPAGILPQVFDEAQLAQPMQQFHNQFNGVSITWQGERRWEDVEAKVQATNVNRSLIDTNESIRSLNSFQKCVMVITTFVAIASFIAIAVSAYYVEKGVTSSDVQELKQQMATNTEILDSLRRYGKGMDSSLRKIANDTLQ
jgi:hypothetical protein